jgi:hypothetical protein
MDINSPLFSGGGLLLLRSSGEAPTVFWSMPGVYVVHEYVQASGGTTTTVNATLGTVSVSGLNAEVEQGTTIAATLGSVTVAGLSATVTTATDITATLGSVTVTGFSAEVEQGTSIFPNAGTVAVTGYNATVTNELTINSTLGTVAVTGYNPEVLCATTITATTGTVNVTGYDASIDFGTTTINATAGTVTVTGYNPEIFQGTTILAAVGAVSVSGKKATVSNLDQTLTLENIAAAVWNSLSASYQTAGTMGKLIADTFANSEFTKGIEGGRWHIVDNQMIFYKDDNVTEIARFNLLNNSGGPTSTAVMQRLRV